MAARSPFQERLYLKVWKEACMVTKMLLLADCFTRIVLCMRGGDEGFSCMCKRSMYKLEGNMFYKFFLSAFPLVEEFDSTPEEKIPDLKSPEFVECPDIFWPSVILMLSPFGLFGRPPDLVCQFSRLGLSVFAARNLPKSFSVPGSLAAVQAGTAAAILRLRETEGLYGLLSYLLEIEGEYFLTLGALSLLDEGCAFHANVSANSWKRGTLARRVVMGARLSTRYFTPCTSRLEKLSCYSCAEASNAQKPRVNCYAVKRYLGLPGEDGWHLGVLLRDGRVLKVGRKVSFLSARGVPSTGSSAGFQRIGSRNKVLIKQPNGTTTCVELARIKKFSHSSVESYFRRPRGKSKRGMKWNYQTGKWCSLIPDFKADLRRSVSMEAAYEALACLKRCGLTLAQNISVSKVLPSVIILSI
jgi:hypothetical protein